MSEQLRESLIEVKDLHVEFDVRAGIVKAVDGLTMTINRGKTLGVIGESGCGKSVTARAILNMIPKPGKITQGEIIYHRRLAKEGQPQIDDIINLVKTEPDGRIIRSIRGGEIGMIFQEPMSSLTPVYTAGAHINEAISLHHLTPVRKVGDQLAEQVIAHRNVTKEEAREIAIKMLRRVGIPKPEERVDSYPHKHMAPGKLQELYHYAWDTFFADGGHQLKMGNLFLKVIHKEMADGTYHRYQPPSQRRFRNHRAST